jgi:hypothetical protein
MIRLDDTLIFESDQEFIECFNNMAIPDGYDKMFIKIIDEDTGKSGYIKLGENKTGPLSGAVFTFRVMDE